MEKNFVFIEEMSIYKKIFFSLVLALNLYIILFEGYILGFVFLGISLFFLMQEGVELNLLDMKYRELSSWYGIKFGKWQKLSPIKYVSIFETNKTTRVRAMGGSAAHFSEVVFKLNLFYANNKHLTLLTSKDKEKIIEIGTTISKILDVTFHKALKNTD